MLEHQEETPEGEEQDPSRGYWAGKPTEEMGSELSKIISGYYETLQKSGMIGLYRNIHAQFYGLSESGSHETSQIVEFGDDGEKLGVRVNHLRSLIRYMHNTATSDRPLILPRAMNNTARAMAQVPTARRVIDYYMKKCRLEKAINATVLRALLYGKGYLWQIWDPSLGALTDPPQDPEAQPQEPGAPPPPKPVQVPEGDLVYRACSPLEMVSDLERTEGDHDWFIARLSRNKYDAAATYSMASDEELSDKIVNMTADAIEDTMCAHISFGLHRNTDKDKDTVYEYHFMHRKTPALPQGRYIIMIGDGLIVFEGDLPFPDVTVSECIPEEFLEAGSVGYASAWDLIGMQQAYNALISTCITNFDAYGHHDMLLPDGIELSVEEVRDGLNAIRFPPGEHNRPTMLEKFSIREEVFKLRDLLKNDMELTSGVNSVARGEPESSLKSGAALALVQAQAVHFINALSAAAVQLLESAGTHTIRLLKAFANTTRISAIAGANDPDGLVAFSSKDLDLIDRIDCEQGNPIFRTIAGKFDMANNLLERGLITDVNQYFAVIETGRLEPVTDPGRKAELRVTEENEILMKGPQPTPRPNKMTGEQEFYIKECPVVMTDHPAKHIAGHASVLDSQEIRQNPTACAAVMAHIMEHLEVWRAAPKDLMALLGYPLPPPLPGDPMLAPPPPEGEGGGKKPGKTQDAGKKPPNGDGTQEGQASPDSGSGMPSLPKPAKPPPGA